MQEFSILHLSDLHFTEAIGDQFSPQSMIAQIQKHFQKTTTRPNLVVVTGDFADQSSVNGTEKFEVALESLKSLQKSLPIPTKAFFFVPGNHDVNCSVKRRLKTQKRFGNYVVFANQFYQDTSSIDKGIMWPQCIMEENAADKLKTVVCLKVEELSVDFLILNSVWAYDYRARRKNISIDKKDITYFETLSNQLINRSTLKIALVHNSPLKLPNPSRVPSDEKFISNSAELLTVLANCGVGLILHGDMHDSQHVATARSLDSWPLYIVGAGRGSAGGAGVPHFHVLNVRLDERINSSEIEVLSYTSADNKIQPLDAICYDLHVPLRSTVAESKTSIHLFELAEPHRPKCQSVPIKWLLFHFRANLFDSLRDKCNDLLQLQETKFYPEEMYTQFYSSIFDFAEHGDFFRAVHEHDWTSWLGTPSYESLKKHRTAAIKGLNIARVIILKDEDVQALLARYNGTEKIDQLMTLCVEVAKLAIEDDKSNGRFDTFLVRAKDIQYLTTIKAEPRPATTAEISPGNIALFTKGQDCQHANETNSIGFYFTSKPISKSGTVTAYLSRMSEKIDFLKSCVTTLWQEEEKFINCKEIKERYQLERFLKEGPHETR